MSERERIAQLIRTHWYDIELGTCACDDNVFMTIMEHSLHVADRIQWRKHRQVS